MYESCMVASAQTDPHNEQELPRVQDAEAQAGTEKQIDANIRDRMVHTGASGDVSIAAAPRGSFSSESPGG